ncbi:hypothetical protein Tco_1014512, partial [Tanacetum coccineum]
IKVKEFQRSFRHSDTERLSRSDEVLKLKNFKKDATLKLSKSTNQEWYEHVSPEVTRSQDDKREGEEKRPIEVDRPIVSVVGNFAIVAFNNACKEEPSSAKSQDTVTISSFWT